MELAERCNYVAEHAQQIARLAVSLFDQTRGVHGLGDRERDWLEYAAIMHDLGVHISYEKHHRHSYYLVKHGDLRGFDPQEIEVMALVTRYHRQAAAQEEPRRLWHAARCGCGGPCARSPPSCRLAEGLDRSHSQPLSASDCTIAARMSSSSCARRAMPSSSSGRRTGT